MTRTVLSLGNFFSVAHFYLIVYVLGPYLSTFMPADSTGLVVALGAVGSLVAFGAMPDIVARFGARRLAIAFGALQAAALFLLAFSPFPGAAILLVAVACATAPLIAYQLDLLLEATVQEESRTGRVRTAFLTAGNVALILAPLAVGFLLDSTEEYARVFLVAAISLLPFIFLFVARRIPEGTKPQVQGLRETLERAFQDRDLRAVVGAEFMLQSFYQLGQLYIPLYLHNALGVPWSELGWVFAVMLLPFVLVEYPAGAVADVLLGDKRLMVAGFVILGFSFGIVAAVGAGTPLSLLLIILILTRIGAALVEAMAEGHFFRRVNEENTGTVSVFRMTRPVAALVAPVFGSALLALVGYGWLFMISGGLLVFIGVLFAFHIDDIRPIRARASAPATITNGQA
jgi:MFS family permease